MGRVLGSLLVALVAFVLTAVVVTAFSVSGVQSQMGAGGLEQLVGFATGIVVGLVTALVVFVLALLLWPSKKKSAPERR